VEMGDLRTWLVAAWCEMGIMDGEACLGRRREMRSMDRSMRSGHGFVVFCMYGSSLMDENGCISHKLCLILSLSAHGAGAACGDVTVRASSDLNLRSSSVLRALPFTALTCST